MSTAAAARWPTPLSAATNEQVSAGNTAPIGSKNLPKRNRFSIPLGDEKASDTSVYALLWTLLAWIIGRIDVSNRERALHVHLNRRAGCGVRIVMHVRYCNPISSRRQRQSMRLIDEIAHPDREGAI